MNETTVECSDRTQTELGWGVCTDNSLGDLQSVPNRIIFVHHTSLLYFDNETLWSPIVTLTVSSCFVIRRFLSFQIDLRNSESGEEIRKSAWRLERGENQLHSTPRAPIKVSYLVIRLFWKTLTHNDELLYVMELRGLLSIVQYLVIEFSVCQSGSWILIKRLEE